MPATKSKKKRGPAPERVKIKGEWSEAMKKALKRKRPVQGWPEPPKKGEG